MASNVILDRLTASGADPATPILVVGHSYGGAVASLVAARLHQGNPARQVRLVTMGSPAPGDVRVQLLLRGVQQVHLSTSNDPIVQLPLRGADLYGLQLLMPAPLLAAWSRWQHASPLTLVDGSPQLTPLPPNTLTFTLLRQMVLAIVARRPLARFPEHDIAEYLRLLGLSSPQPLTFPMPAPVKALLLPSPVLSINAVIGLTATIGP